MELNVVSKWDRRFLDMAALVASWSKDPSTKCGAVIVRSDHTVASVGYNGFPKYCDDDEKFYLDRELKLARVVHAEVNAILLASEDVTGMTMYTYQDPMIGPSCDRCSAHVIQAGIKKVVTYECTTPARYIESINRGLDMYEEARVEVVRLGA